MVILLIQRKKDRSNEKKKKKVGGRGEREDRKRKGSSTQIHRLIERENYRQKKGERERERFERNDSLIPHAEERRKRGGVREQSPNRGGCEMRTT